MKKIIFAGILLLLFTFSFQIFSQENPKFNPAPVYSDLLSTITVEQDGRFKPRSMFAFFMQGEKGILKILHEGQEFAEYKFISSIYSGPKFELDGFDLVKGKNDVLGLKLNKPGKYELQYFIEGKKFYKFPFELVINSNKDPYNPKKTLLINGAWNNYAYLYKTSNESHGKWQFKVFTRSDDGSYKQTKSYLRIVNNQTKQVVAISRNNFRREGRWKLQTLELKKPGKLNKKINEYYDNKDIYANKDKFVDGNYTLNFYMDNKLYGSYKFMVKNGEIQLQGRQVRSSTDSTKFIEGGGREFWMKKQ